MLLPLLLLSLSLVSQGKNATRPANNKKVHTLPIVITTWSADGFQQANENGFNALPGGRLHALVEGLSTCERLQCDTTVGFGGSPDESGETTLDAMLIDGPGHRLASVAQLHRVKDAARVAWAVMNYTRHTMLVGEAATQFAVSMGFKESSLSSNVSRSMMDEWKKNSCQPNFRMNVSPDATNSCGPYKPLKMIKERVKRATTVDRFHHDTIGMVVIDKDGEVSAGTSTNGARYKIPGRVGDSPIPGAGAYLMKGVGGAAATGDGDVMMRFLPSFTAVEWMRQGVPPAKAARKALTRILEFYHDFQGAVVAANVHGDVGAACAGLKSFGYSVRTGDDGKTRVETVQCIH